jgi:diguanylate cyclase (GGDEF)-like protein
MVLALLVLNSLLGTLCLVVARSDRKSEALRLWGWGNLAYAAGLLITVATFLPLPLIKITGNALIAYAPVLSITGTLNHTPVRLNTRWVTLGYIASVVPIAVNHMGQRPLVLVDFLAPAPLANILFVVAAVALFRNPTPDARTAARFVAATFVFAVVVWTVRMFTLWLSVGGTNDRDRSDLTVALFAIAQMVVGVATTLGLLWIEVRKMEADLNHIAYFDLLTGLPNRRATMMRFRDEVARADRHGQPFAMVVMDIDHFKLVNDTYGHRTGDTVLARVAHVLGEAKRSEDVLGRIGGEEFVLLLSGCSGDAAKEAANRIRERVAAARSTHDDKTLTVTLSGGISTYPSEGTDWDALFSVADQRLYAAKQSGRNRIVGGSAGAGTAA